jgi:hypothetical protein
MGYKEHYSNSSNNDIQKEAEEIASIVYDYELRHLLLLYYYIHLFLIYLTLVQRLLIII